jgi:hypothetical protein
MNASPAHRIMGAVVIAACISAFGCAGPEKPKVEAAPSPATVEAKQQQMAKLPPPDLEQVQQAVKRVFKDSAVVDVSQQPSFVPGDFNGDLSQDLAVIVKPGPGKLAEINEEFPNWILRDLFRPREAGTPPLRVEENEVLLAIIHGFGSDGWRDSQATQTYLLKNAAGTGIGVQTGREFAAANTGKALPGLHGDLISQVIRGTAGYLYYAGATYSWYDPKTFKGEVDGRVVHGRAPAVAR